MKFEEGKYHSLENQISSSAKEAQESILRIRAFVSYLKEGIPELQDTPFRSKGIIRTTTTAAKTTTSFHRGEDKLDELKSVGIFARLNDKKINCNITGLDELRNFITSEDAHEESQTNASSFWECDRNQVVFSILHPLLESLYMAYHELDHLSETSPPENPEAYKSKNKPKAPVGLLSLADYTDIACILEFLVTTSILPHLDSNILMDASKRTKVLPKSMRGRIQLKALLWGSTFNDNKSPVSISKATQLAKEVHESTMLLAKLCTMDRFSPMMLPRHMADIYAGIFQAHHVWDMIDRTRGKLQQYRNDTDLSKCPKTDFKAWQIELYRRLRLRFLVHDDDRNFYCTRKLDSVLTIKAYQTLLLCGSSSPLWLRLIVSQQLTYFAKTSHLDAVVAVFVKAADHLPGADMTAAASRLARALLVGAGSDLRANLEPIFSQLVQMMFDFVDTGVASETRTPMTSLAGPATAASLVHLLLPDHQTIVFDFWIRAILLQIHQNTCSSYIVVSDVDLSRMIHSFFVWLCLTSPPTTDVAHILLNTSATLFGTEIFGDMTVFQIFIRIIASAPLSRENQTAQQVLAQVLQSHSQGRKDSKNDLTILEDKIIEAISNCEWDQDGKVRFAASSSGACEMRSKVESDSLEDTMLNDIECRAKAMIEVLKGLASNADKAGPESSLNLLPQLFEVVVKNYLTILLPKSSPADTYTRNKFTSMVLLPLMIEKCDLSTLLGASAIDIFRLIRSVLEASSPAFKDLDKIKRPRPSREENGGVEEKDYRARLDNVELLLSTCDLFLSLLVAILELGNDARSTIEESYLESFGPILETYASSPSLDHSSLEVKQACAQLAEISAHACALIASRGMSNREKKEKREASPTASQSSDNLTTQLDMAQEDLEDDMPPIRARGITRLTKLARAATKAHDQSLRQEALGSNLSIHSRPLITCIDETSEEERFVKVNFDHVVSEKVFYLAAKALADDESYVYLAAMQTLSALCDTNPALFLPKMVKSFVYGKLHLHHNMVECVDLHLSQRAKMAEATIFAVRRRGAAADSHLHEILPILLHGCTRQQSNHDDSKKFMIQKETHTFLSGSIHGGDEDKVNNLEEIAIRLNVGGPVFESEESDTVRSSSLICLAEVISLASFKISSRYVDLIVRLCTDALQLEESRPVRRASALLARELYIAALREVEYNAHLQRAEGSYEIPFNLALADKEQHLYNILSSIVAQRDHLGKLYDPATAARAKEAVNERELLSQLGILSIAKIVWKEKDNTPEILRNLVKPKEFMLDL